MHCDAPTPGGGILVIGHGNTLRSDDGAGFLVAQAVGSWDRPAVRSLAVQQLTPELAEWLARAERVVFVDARLAADGADLAISPVEPASSLRPAGHISDPPSLLALARWIHGRSPRASLLTIPGVDFSIGEQISATAAKSIDHALERIAWIVEDVRR